MTVIALFVAKSLCLLFLLFRVFLLSIELCVMGVIISESLFYLVLKIHSSFVFLLY